MADRKVVLVPEGLNGERVDAAVARMLGLSRSRVVELIGAGQVLLDGAAITKSDRVSVGSMLEVELDDQPRVARAIEKAALTPSRPSPIAHRPSPARP